MNADHIAKRIGQALRAKRGDVSLRSYATTVGVSFSTLTRLEKGEHPNFRDLVQVAWHLGPRYTAGLFNE